MKRRFFILLALTTTLAIGGLFASSTAALADPPGGHTVTTCSTWYQPKNSQFQIQACVAIDYSGTNVHHFGYVEWLGPRTSPGFTLYLYDQINGSLVKCAGAINVAVASGHFYEEDCYTAQSVGKHYASVIKFTDSSVPVTVTSNSPELVDSPKSARVVRLRTWGRRCSAAPPLL
jgi:hypothetical protein